MSVFEDVRDEKLICSHCGDKCDDKITNGEREAFCCQGCKTVHEILHENGLDAYYRIENKPGISLKNSKGKDYFSYLQNENI